MVEVDQGSVLTGFLDVIFNLIAVRIAAEMSRNHKRWSIKDLLRSSSTEVDAAVDVALDYFLFPH